MCGFSGCASLTPNVTATVAIRVAPLSRGAPIATEFDFTAVVIDAPARFSENRKTAASMIVGFVGATVQRSRCTSASCHLLPGVRLFWPPVGAAIAGGQARRTPDAPHHAPHRRPHFQAFLTQIPFRGALSHGGHGSRKRVRFS